VVKNSDGNLLLLWIIDNKICTQGGMAKLKVGDIVYYNGEEVEVYFMYDSGYCEIKRLHRIRIQLVHQSELIST
jgi:hypothetical protein